jgi:hypothetical protein
VGRLCAGNVSVQGRVALLGGLLFAEQEADSLCVLFVAACGSILDTFYMKSDLRNGAAIPKLSFNAI